MPAQVMEERLRDAFHAAAETVTARDLPGLPAPQDRSWMARRLPEWAPRARVRAVIPVAAAACVALIVARVVGGAEGGGRLAGWRDGYRSGGRASVLRGAHGKAAG